MNTRRSKLQNVVVALEKLKNGEQVPPVLKPSRYRDGLSKVSVNKREKLLSDLRLHIQTDAGQDEIAIQVD